MRLLRGNEKDKQDFDEENLDSEPRTNLVLKLIQRKWIAMMS